MQNLADAVLDYYFFLYFADNGKLDAERAVKLTELFDQIEYRFLDDEKQALKDAAARRLKQRDEIIENGGLPQYPNASTEVFFLGNIAGGHFDIVGLDDLRDPNEDLSDCDE